METITFAVAARQFFGLLPGTGLKDFAAELKELTVDDKKELAALLSVELQKFVAV